MESSVLTGDPFVMACAAVAAIGYAVAGLLLWRERRRVKRGDWYR